MPLGFMAPDHLIAWATAAGVVIALVGLWFTYREVKRAVGIRLAERAESLMSLLLDIERIAVEHPRLAPYFQSRKQPPLEDGELRDQIFAYALLYTDFAETVGWQIKAGQMSRESADEWRLFLRDLHLSMPAIRDVLVRDAWMLAGETRWLFGAGRVTPALRKLGIKEELELRELREQRNDELLAAVHHELFMPNFPDPDEQESPDDWAPRLWESPQPPVPEQHATVAGIHLNKPDQRFLAGFAFVERYRESSCALLSYIAVDPSWRKQGLATDLYHSALGSARRAARGDEVPLRAVFAEIHDPARVQPSADAIDPAARVRIMDALGAMRIPISYVQPALGPDAERSDRLMLIAFPEGEHTTVDENAVRDFLREYFLALGVADPESDPDFARMVVELELLGPDVQLTPLTR